MTLDFIVNNQTLTKHKSQSTKKIVADSRNYLKAVFHFQSPEWENQICYALFTIQGQTYKQILGAEKDLEWNECYVPEEVIHNPGFSVSCYCGDRITTNEVRIDVVSSGYTEDIVNQRVTPSVMDQANALLKKYALICNSILQDCGKIEEEIKKHKEVK